MHDTESSPESDRFENSQHPPRSTTRSIAQHTESPAPSIAAPSLPPRPPTPTQRHPYGIVTRAPSTPVATSPSYTSRKRGAGGDSAHEPRTPTSEPLPKKARLHPRSRHALGRFTFSGPSINRHEPPSPLFFSNSPHLRPHLPPRYSSSEAGAKMLSKAKSEDSHVKTVTLARGTVTTPSIPTSAPLRRSMERISLGRSESPDINIRGDVPLASLASIGILELLEQDDRLTWIIDLADSQNYGSGPLHPVFANSSLRSSPALLALLSGTPADEMAEPSPSATFLHLKGWVLSAAVNGESLTATLPPFHFAGVSWQVSTLRRRFRVISGSMVTSATHHSSSAGASIRTAHSANGSVTPAPSTHSVPSAPAERSGEPLDYFGQAALPVSSHPTSTPSTISPTGALPTVESADHPKTIQQTTQRNLEGSFADRKASPLHMLDAFTSSSPYENMLSAQAAGNVDLVLTPSAGFVEGPSYDWTRLPVSSTMPEHVQFARSVDWSQTALGPIESWSADLRQMCNLIMASPHPAAMYWGEELIAIYNEAYILLAVSSTR